LFNRSSVSYFIGCRNRTNGWVRQRAKQGRDGAVGRYDTPDALTR